MVGLTIKRHYTREGEDIKNSLQWRKSNIKIENNIGQIIYENNGVNFPDFWRELPRKVVASKYFYKGDGDDHTEKDLYQLVLRVGSGISDSGVDQGYFNEDNAKPFRDEIMSMVLNQIGSFNSPVWFNVGLFEQYGVTENKENGESAYWARLKDGSFSKLIDAYERPQASACFIQSIKDNMVDILDHAKREAMLFKHGSGTGTNYGPLRGVNEPLSGGGIASGQTSFMRIYDIIAGSVQSGGKTRRAAKMVINPVDHPDIFRFINWKVEEEKKALWLSANTRWAPRNNRDLESEAYKTVTGQNGNNSVRVTDEFMEAALRGEDWNLWFRTADRFDKEVEIPLEKYCDDRSLPDKRFIKILTNKRKVVNAGTLLEQISRAASVTGDPAIQYHDAINKWHTCPNSAPINASNPCSEFMFIDDSACNLASLNLMKFKKEKSKSFFDIKSFKHGIFNFIRAQNILVDYGSYPREEIAKNSHKFRPLGLGYTNLGALLMSEGLSYDSEDGRAMASAVTSLMTAYAYQASAELSRKFGAFEEFEKNKEPMMNVLKMHQEEHGKINKKDSKLESLLREGEKAWVKAIADIEKYGARNAQTTLLAPTGTIGFMMDVDCTGIEPMPALVYQKGLAGGGELNMDLKPCVRNGLEKLGYNGEKLEEIVNKMKENGTVIDSGLKEEHYSIFATAFGDNTISVDGHLEMMSAVQPFLSGAISKTVNLPRGSTIQDVRDTYIKGWKLGLKSISLYIDGSKGIQPINIKTKKDKNELIWGERIKPINPMLPGGYVERPGWNIDIGGIGVHLMVGEYEARPPKDAPADFFVQFGSSGNKLAASYASWGKEASRNRQRGGTLQEFIKHNIGADGTINGFTDHPFIKSCSSIEDMFAKLIQFEYLGGTELCDVKPTETQMKELRCNILANRRRVRHFQSRIDFIETAMQDGKLISIFPLYEDELTSGDISIMDRFCIKCGHKTILSGANCRKCLNCGEAVGCG